MANVLGLKKVRIAVVEGDEMFNDTRKTVVARVFESYPKVIEKVRGVFYFSGIVEVGKNLVDLEIQAFESEEIKNLKKYVKNKKLDAIVLIYDICRKRISNKDFNAMVNEVNSLPPEVLRASVGVQLVEKVILNEEDEKKIAESIKAPQYKIDFAKSEDRCYKSLASPFVELVKNVLEKRNKQYGENIKEQVAELEEKKKEEEMKEQKDKLEEKEDLSNTEKVNMLLLGKYEEAKYWITKFAFIDKKELVLERRENFLRVTFNYLNKKIDLTIQYFMGEELEELKNLDLKEISAVAFVDEDKGITKKYGELIKRENIVKAYIETQFSDDANEESKGNTRSYVSKEGINMFSYHFDLTNEEFLGPLADCFIDIVYDVLIERIAEKNLLESQLEEKGDKKDGNEIQEPKSQSKMKLIKEKVRIAVIGEGKKMDKNINSMFMFDPFKDYGKIIRKEFKRDHFLSALMEFDETLIELEIKAFEHDETEELEKYVNKNHSAVLVFMILLLKKKRIISLKLM